MPLLIFVFFGLLIWLILHALKISSIKFIVGTNVIRFFYKQSTRSSRAHQNHNPIYENQFTGDKYRPPMNDQSAYKILELHSNASKEEITSAYRKLVKQYHPDKVATLAPEFREVAEQRMKEINAAYAQLKRHITD